MFYLSLVSALSLMIDQEWPKHIEDILAIQQNEYKYICWTHSYITIHHISNSIQLRRELIKHGARDVTISSLDVG